MNLKLIVVLLQNLPAILKLLENLDKRMKAAEMNKKISDDIKTINNAFEANNAEELNKLFNS